MSKYTRNRYPDGSVYCVVNDLTINTIIERINNYEDLFFIQSIKDVLDYNLKNNLELRIPCLIQQQHDERFRPNESYELKNICKFINSLNFNTVTVFHPHSSSTEMGLHNCRVLNNTNYIHSVITELKSQGIGDDLVLLSPDAGAFKWVTKMANVIEFPNDVFTAAKYRDPKTHKLTQVLDKEDFKGKDVLIVDDICVYGGTFIGLAELLRQKNANSINLAVSHMTVTNPNKKLNELYDNVFVTNSKYDEYDLEITYIYDVLKELNDLS